MAKFTMLIGLPGSRKPRMPDESVDYQNMFEEMHRETAFHLKNGRNVIDETTNLASKRRKSVLNRIEKFLPEKEAVVSLTPYDMLKSRNSQRQDAERVPDPVIDRCIRAFQRLRKDEKFDCVRILSNPPYTSLDIAKLKKQAFSCEENEAFFQSFEETRPMTETVEMRTFLQQTYK